MTHDDVLDAIRSLRVITHETEMTVMGSQAVHGRAPDVVDSIMYSREVDVVLHTKAGLANWISDVVGEGSMFEQNKGYFIDHLRPTEGLPVLVPGWEARAVPFDADTQVKSRFLSLEDLYIAKLGAGREKDIEFLARLSKTDLVDSAQLRTLLAAVPQQHKDRVLDTLNKVVNRIDALTLKSALGRQNIEITAAEAEQLLAEAKLGRGANLGSASASAAQTIPAAEVLRLAKPPESEGNGRNR